MLWYWIWWTEKKTIKGAVQHVSVVCSFTCRLLWSRKNGGTKILRVFLPKFPRNGCVLGEISSWCNNKNTAFSRTLRIVIITTNIFPHYCVHSFINLTAIKISFMDEIFPIPPNSNSDWVYNETKYVVFLLRVKQWMTHSQIIFIFTFDFTQDNEYYLLYISDRIECNWWLEIMWVHFHCIFMKCKQDQQIIKSNHQKNGSQVFSYWLFCW